MSVSKKLTVSASPHVRSSATATGIMLDVIIALIPSLIAATVSSSSGASPYTDTPSKLSLLLVNSYFNFIQILTLLQCN